MTWRPSPALALTLATLAVTVTVTATVTAQPRVQRLRLPIPTVLPGAPVTLVHVERASARDARDALPPRTAAVARCITEARAADPVRLARLRALDVTVRLRPTGEADAVEIDPPSLPPGLSACLGSALLAWRQGGHTAPRAAVQLRIDLATPRPRPRRAR